MTHKSVNIDDTFNLDSDFGAFIKTKPASILILEKEIKISNRIDFPRVVVKQLYSLDEDIFRQALLSSANFNLLYFLTDFEPLIVMIDNSIILCSTDSRNFCCESSLKTNHYGQWH